jgi:putative membrane protein
VEFISAEVLAAVKQHNNKPLALLQLNGKDIKVLREKRQLEIFSKLQLDKTVSAVM